MQHHALLVSRQSDEQVEVTLEVANGHVEMSVDETSVGRWPITRFIAYPVDRGFQLAADGDRWLVEPRDRPLFEADTLARIPRLSRAYFVNRYPRITRAADVIRSGGLRPTLTRLLTVCGLSIGSFGLGIIVGRFRLDGTSVSTWVFMAFVLAGSVVVTQLLSAPTEIPESATHNDTRNEALDHLMATLRFHEPNVPPAPSVDAVGDSSADAPSTEQGASDPGEQDPVTVVTAETDGQAVADSEAPTVDASSEQLDTNEKPDRPVRRASRLADTEPVVDRGRIRLPTGGDRKQYRREDPDPASMGGQVLVIEVEPADDLTEIHGVGPTFAALLNELGIHSFRQLASIDESTLDTLRDRMGPFAGRIERDQWIEAAALAHRLKVETRSAPVD